MAKRILRGLIPWIVLGMALQFAPAYLLLPIWLGLLLLLVVSNRRFLRIGHPISWTNLFFFVLLFINGYFGISPWVREHASVVCYGALFVVGSGTIIAGTPLTTAYARMHVPREKWDHATFKQINLILSGGWVGVFAANGIISFFASPYPIASQVARFAFMVGAIVFSDWYPKFARARSRTLAAVDQRPVSRTTANGVSVEDERAALGQSVLPPIRYPGQSAAS